MRNSKTSFQWIVGILNSLHIPFQIAGGLAARAYGATRELEDIDFDIPDDQLPRLYQEIKEYVTFGPDRYQDEHWDLLLMTINHHGQAMDFAGSDSTKIRHHVTKKWLPLLTDFNKTNIMKIFDINVPVIPRTELISYKTIISRPVDLIDVEQIFKIGK